MSERCPLNKGLYWANASNAEAIPDFCLEHCLSESGRETLLADSSVRDTDIFVPEKEIDNHDPQYNDESLGRHAKGNSNGRTYSILNDCVDCGVELFAEQTDFICPND